MDVMPPFLTPGDGRSRAQGTDLPRRWVEKWQQRHFGFLYETKRLHLQSFFISGGGQDDVKYPIRAGGTPLLTLEPELNTG